MIIGYMQALFWYLDMTNFLFSSHLPSKRDRFISIYSNAVDTGCLVSTEEGMFISSTGIEKNLQLTFELLAETFGRIIVMLAHHPENTPKNVCCDPGLALLREVFEATHTMCSDAGCTC